MKKYIAFLALLCMLPIFNSCGGEKTYKIAAVYSSVVLTAHEVKPIKYAARLVVNELNEEYSGGMRFEIEYFDNKGDPKKARSIAKQIARDEDILAVLGYSIPNCLLASKDIYTKNNVPVLASALMRNGIVDSSDSVFIYNLMEDAQASAIVDYIKNGIKRTNVVTLTQSSSVDTYDAIYSYFLEYKSGINHLTNLVYKSGEVEFKAFAAQIQNLSPEVVVIIGNYREAAFINAAVKKNLTKIDIIGISKIVHGDYIPLSGAKRADGSYGITSFVYSRGENMSVDNLNDAYAKLSGRSIDTVALNTYEAGALVKEAMRMRKAERRAILSYIKGINSEESSFRAMQERVYFNKDNELVQTPVVAEVRGEKWAKSPKQFDSIKKDKSKSNKNGVTNGR